MVFSISQWAVVLPATLFLHCFADDDHNICFSNTVFLPQVQARVLRTQRKAGQHCKTQETSEIPKLSYFSAASKKGFFDPFPFENPYSKDPRLLDELASIVRFNFTMVTEKINPKLMKISDYDEKIKAYRAHFFLPKEEIDIAIQELLAFARPGFRDTYIKCKLRPGRTMANKGMIIQELADEYWDAIQILRVKTPLFRDVEDWE